MPLVLSRSTKGRTQKPSASPTATGGAALMKPPPKKASMSLTFFKPAGSFALLLDDDAYGESRSGNQTAPGVVDAVRFAPVP